MEFFVTLWNFLLHFGFIFLLLFALSLRYLEKSLSVCIALDCVQLCRQTKISPSKVGIWAKVAGKFYTHRRAESALFSSVFYPADTL